MIPQHQVKFLSKSLVFADDLDQTTKLEACAFLVCINDKEEQRGMEFAEFLCFMCLPLPAGRHAQGGLA